MPRSLYKQGVRHPLNPENSEFLYTLGQKRTQEDFTINRAAHFQGHPKYVSPHHSLSLQYL
jgi:hypothetical protein